MHEWNESHPFFDYTEYDFYGENPEADFERWTKAPCWTVEEGIALTFGKNPRVVNQAFLSSCCPEHPFAREYEARLEQGIRAKKIGDLQPVNRPAHFLRWAKTIGIEFPVELKEAINWAPKFERFADGDLTAEYEKVVIERNKLAAQLTEVKSKLSETQPPLESERKSMLTIIAAMAREGYKHPASGNSHVTKEIADDITKIGLGLDEKTIRKYLKTAMDLVPVKTPN